MALHFPSSRVLAGWWRQLLPLSPEAIWVGHLFLHRVEALVHFVASQPLDKLNHLLLQAIHLEWKSESAPPLLERLQARLHFPPPILNQLLRNLGDLGLVRHGDGAMRLTEHGEAALSSMQFPQPKVERRVFTFLERLDPAGSRLGDPAFLPLTLDRGQNWHPSEPLPFRFEWLQSCQSQSAAWKRTHGFPETLDKIILPGADLSDWKNVVVLRPERIVAALARTADGVCAFLAKPDGWTLAATQPIFTLSAEALLAHPELTPAMSDGDVARAWQHLAESHHLTPDEVKAASIEHANSELRVRLPESVQARFRLHRDDCTLLGEGCVRRLARVVVVG
jgi:hypothetical protein